MQTDNVALRDALKRPAVREQICARELIRRAHLRCDTLLRQGSIKLGKRTTAYRLLSVAEIQITGKTRALLGESEMKMSTHDIVTKVTLNNNLCCRKRSVSVQGYKSHAGKQTERSVRELRKKNDGACKSCDWLACGTLPASCEETRPSGAFRRAM